MSNELHRLVRSPLLLFTSHIAAMPYVFMALDEIEFYFICTSCLTLCDVK